MQEQIIVRMAKMQDKKDFYRLWKICFADSDAFCDWFFGARFLPEYSVCLEAEGEIASCMQAYPFDFWVRGKAIPGAMLCGVSTHPEQRKKGFMGKIFRYEMQLLRQKGCLIAPHTPAVLESYFSFGHFPVADAAYLSSRCVPAFPRPAQVISPESAQWEQLFPLYERFAAGYSGMIRRTKADHLRKMEDYAVDGGKCVAYIENGEICGYAIYYKLEKRLFCAEAVAEKGYWSPLMEGLFAEAEGCAFLAKLPPDVVLSYPFAQTVRKQKGVMGLCDLSGLLRALDLKIPYSFRIKDDVIAENNGCFDFHGSPSADAPVFEMEAGHFLQVLVGYYSLEDLRGQIVIWDEEKFQEIHRLLPKQNCYIIDEY